MGRAALAALAAAGLASCRPAPAPPPDTLRIALRADVTGFFPGPPLVNEAGTLQANRSVYESLVRFDPALRLRPGLAERWSNPDDRTYRFELRPGVRFSDGKPLTPGDVAASLEANRRGWATRDYLQAVESVRAIGERTVEIRTRFPYLALLTRLPWAPVLPREAAERGLSPAPGTGPYRVESWNPGRGYVFVRNPYNDRDPPAFARVVHAVVPDDAARVALVERGEADAADQVPLEEVERLSQNPALRVVSGAGLRVLFLGLRVDRPPFSDPRVREAIDLALDRGELSRRALGGRAEPATQLVPPSIVGFEPALRLPAPDPARARALLSSAGHPRGLDVRLDGPSNRYVNDVAILRELARQLDEVGVRTAVNALDKRDFFPLIEHGGSAMHLLGFSCESGDAGDLLGSLAHSATGGPLGSLNSFGLADRTLDDLIGLADRARTDRGRARQLRLAVARAAELRAALPLVVQAEAVVLSRRLAWEAPLNMALSPEALRPAPSRSNRSFMRGSAYSGAAMFTLIQ
jgi:peptide/nickel transport system substrate-binding protein